MNKRSPDPQPRSAPEQRGAAMGGPARERLTELRGRGDGESAFTRNSREWKQRVRLNKALSVLAPTAIFLTLLGFVVLPNGNVNTSEKNTKCGNISSRVYESSAHFPKYQAHA